MYKRVYDFVKIKEYPDKRIATIKVCHKPPVVYHSRKPIEDRRVSTAIKSAVRSNQSIFDIVSCNTFKYFVTLTFGTQSRLSDSSVKNDWDNWRTSFRKKFPRAYYLAVPEYHSAGGLHIHMCLGGITSDELKLITTKYVCCSWVSKKYISVTKFNKQKELHELKATDGLPIYNVGAWSLGFSTATEIYSQSAVLHYISKYISKGGVDPRFCDSKRYWCSKNINRPVVVQFCNDHLTSQTDFHYAKKYALEFTNNEDYFVFNLSLPADPNVVLACHQIDKNIANEP